MSKIRFDKSMYDPEVTMYLITKGIKKRLGPRDNLVSKNSKYMNDVIKQVNL
jgi:hypothetical protein